VEIENLRGYGTEKRGGRKDFLDIKMRKTGFYERDPVGSAT
jgi:hypothetical protein